MADTMRNGRWRTAPEGRGAAPAAEETAVNPTVTPAAEEVPGEPALAATRPAGALAATGLLTLLLGAWAGICVFVGPVFGYSVDGTASWTWNLPHAWLHLAPGALAVLAGFLLFTSAGRRAGLLADAPSPTATLAGMLAVVAGAWLVVGPLAWPVQHGAGPVWAPASPLRNLADQVGANLGPGVLLCGLGGLAMGLGRRRRMRRALVR